MGDHAAILALLLHHQHHAISISQNQQIVLNCKGPIRISDVDTILRPAIRITAKADGQFPLSAHR